MNLLPKDNNNLNEVVFKNRNKSYGAYAIRTTYNSAIAKSLLYLSSLLVLIFGSAFTYNKLTYTLPEVNVVAYDDVIIDSVYITTIDNTPIEPIIPVEEAAAPKGITTPTAITDDAPIEPAPTGTTQVSIAGQGDPESVGNSTISLVSTSVAVVPVEVVPTPNEAEPFAEHMPVFNTEKNGILNYVATHISYPPTALAIGIEGTVHVSFVVNELGKVENMKVLKGLGYGCDEEVVRMLSKMPTWMKPGRNGDKPVKVRYNIPVRFRLR